MQLRDEYSDITWRPIKEVSAELGVKLDTLHKWTQRGYVRKLVTRSGCKAMTWICQEDTEGRLARRILAKK